MYCINCGVKLADSETKCPLCNTVVFHPDIKRPVAETLYPHKKMPKSPSNSKVLSGAIVIIYFIPLIISFFSDLNANGTLDWFGYVAGALVVSYVVLALPLWFKKPDPVIFVPCNFVVAALYLWYINWATKNDWFLPFALPIVVGLGIITCTVITLKRSLQKGQLYIFGGASIACGCFMLLIEYLLGITFQIQFVGWSIYPMVVLILLGALLIYLAINHTAREVIERKLFF